MSGQYYQPPPEQQQQYHPPHLMPVEKKGIESFFIAKDKIGLFLFLCIGMVIIGFLLLDMMKSGLVDPDSAIYFLGMLAVDVGILAIIALVLVSGICREDMTEKSRNALILAATIILVVFIFVYTGKTTFGLLGF